MVHTQWNRRHDSCYRSERRVQLIEEQVTAQGGLGIVFFILLFIF